MKTERRIFWKGSTTFFISTLFFPPETRRDVFELYGFLRVADDYVDRIPADENGFYHFRSLWEKSVRDPLFEISRLKSDTEDIRVIKNMHRVSRKYGFDPEWIEVFLNAMQSDLKHKKCNTADDMLAYMYGSGEVVGLMMARIMRLPPEAYDAARMQGRAMQMINFIRDIEEDNRLLRQYFPSQDLKRFNLADLSHETALSQPTEFKKFMRYQLEYYEKWQAEASKGYKFIPKRLRIPLETASDMYGWTAVRISREPLVIFDKKIKPSRPRVICKLLTNLR